MITQLLLAAKDHPSGLAFGIVVLVAGYGMYVLLTLIFPGDPKGRRG